MKKFLQAVTLTLLILATAPVDARDTYVQGYTRSNGTYVQPHYRSAPNGTVTDNYSYRGNTNPHTGSVGSNTYSNSPSSPYYGGSQPYGGSYGNQNNSYGGGNSIYGN